MEIVDGFMRFSCAGRGFMFMSKSAEPDLEVEARLPCLASRRREEARMEEVVEMLKVLWESPPVPTMSHYAVSYVNVGCINKDTA